MNKSFSKYGEKLYFKVKSLLFMYIIGVSSLFACPYEILNDFNKTLIVVNPNLLNKIYFIEPQQKINVDSTIENKLLSIIRYESLDFYLPKANGEFQKIYSLIEKYCSQEKTTLAFSEIKRMAKYPTDRFEVKVSYLGDLKS